MPRFIRCASHLTRDTGNDLDTVGLSSEYNNTSISIYGDYDNGHELIISEFVIKVGGVWTEVSPTDTQRAALAAILAKEVENVRQIRDEDIEMTLAQLDLENEIDRYGMEGAVYGKYL